jgi:methionyl-tRNA formyltransferase
MRKSEMLCLVVSKLQGLKILECVQQQLGAQIQVITCDDRDDIGRTVFEAIREFCVENNLNFLVLNGPSLSQYLIDHKPDLCLISGWYWIIESPALTACRLGCLGVHNSLLPSFRGGAPLVWSIMSGERTVGASLFIMGEGMDDGPLIHQWTLEIDETEYIDGILTRLEEAVVSDLGVIIREFLLGIRKSYPQSTNGISYAPTRRKKDSEINWNDSAESLFNQCRALQNPFPLLFFKKNEIEYQIRRLEKAPLKCYGPSGKVLAYIESGVVVSCGINTDGIILTDVLDSGGTNAIPRKPFPIGAILANRKE